jgi:hypothetical protein
MSQMSDITITESDDTTSRTFTAMVPASGDKSPAVWRASESYLPGHRSTLTYSSRWNGNRTARKW